MACSGGQSRRAASSSFGTALAAARAAARAPLQPTLHPGMPPPCPLTQNLEPESRLMVTTACRLAVHTPSALESVMLPLHGCGKEGRQGEQLRSRQMSHLAGEETVAQPAAQQPRHALYKPAPPASHSPACLGMEGAAPGGVHGRQGGLGEGLASGSAGQHRLQVASQRGSLGASDGRGAICVAEGEAEGRDGRGGAEGRDRRQEVGHDALRGTQSSTRSSKNPKN